MLVMLIIIDYLCSYILVSLNNHCAAQYSSILVHRIIKPFISIFFKTYLINNVIRFFTIKRII